MIDDNHQILFKSIIAR